MTIYYFIILGLLGLGYVLTEKREERNKTFCYLSISCFVLTFFASFRYAIGFDYFSYQDIYEKIKHLVIFFLINKSHSFLLYVDYLGKWDVHFPFFYLESIFFYFLSLCDLSIKNQRCRGLVYTFIVLCNF